MQNLRLIAASGQLYEALALNTNAGLRLFISFSAPDRPSVFTLICTPSRVHFESGSPTDSWVVSVKWWKSSKHRDPGLSS
jgi:hypothetical protein